MYRDDCDDFMNYIVFYPEVVTWKVEGGPGFRIIKDVTRGSREILIQFCEGVIASC